MRSLGYQASRIEQQPVNLMVRYCVSFDLMKELLGQTHGRNRQSNRGLRRDDTIEFPKLCFKQKFPKEIQPYG